jgi:2-amino-4-hydroxy-6-hydroxymethyldihydropteridine diphosphokinase
MPEPAPPAMAYVAVGSNIEPRKNIPAALALLREHVTVAGVSTFYHSAAVGPDGRTNRAQSDFVNGVFEVRATQAPRELKYGVLRRIEERLGRVRTADKFAPRTIDLDVALYGDDVIDEPDLKLPAPDIARPFVAVPLLELAPDLVLPHTHEPLSCLWRGGIAGLTADAELTRALKEICRR